MQTELCCSRVSPLHLSPTVCLLPPRLRKQELDRRLVFSLKSHVDDPFTGMITIPAASLAGAQIVQAGGANTNTTNSGQGTVTVTLPVSGNMVNAGGMVMVRPCNEVPNILFIYLLETKNLDSQDVVEVTKM